MALWTPLIMYDINDQWSFMIIDHVDHVWNLLIMPWSTVDHSLWSLIMLWSTVDHRLWSLIMLWSTVDHTLWSLIIAMINCWSYAMIIDHSYEEAVDHTWCITLSCHDESYRDHYHNKDIRYFKTICGSIDFRATPETRIQSWNIWHLWTVNHCYLTI